MKKRNILEFADKYWKIAGMGILLTEHQKKGLIAKHRCERDKRVCDRIKAVLAYDDGYSYTEIAKLLLLDDETIRRYIKDYVECKKLATENGGSESKLNEQQTEELIAHLGETIYLYVKDICAYVNLKYAVKYSISGMTDWLKNHGFRYKKPHAVPAKLDEAKQQKFVRHYRRLKAKAAKKGEPIFFADSVHPQHQTQLMYGWIRIGERKAVPMTGRQYRVNIMGAICLNGHKVVYDDAEKIDADSIIGFLIKVRKNYPAALLIHVILDNAGYHRSKEVVKFCKKNRIKLHYLPPYSPNLNPIERLWKVMHEHVNYNRYYEKFADFYEATLSFFRNIKKHNKILRSRITDNFHMLKQPTFAS